jgi:hypothetical protein
VAGGFPDPRVHQNPGVQPDHVRAFVDEGLPPEALDVVLEFHAERTEVPGVGQSAIDIGAGIDEATTLGERDDFVHGGGAGSGVSHEKAIL